jgi:hypothetical protein
MDSVKMGLICIFLISVTIGVTGLFKGGDKGLEIALASLNGMSLIGGWLGHSIAPGQDTGHDTLPPAKVPDA